MVSAPGIAASNFAHGHAVASNLAKYDLWTIKSDYKYWIYVKNARKKTFQF